MGEEQLVSAQFGKGRVRSRSGKWSSKASSRKWLWAGLWQKSCIWKVHLHKFHHPITLEWKISNSSFRIIAWHLRSSIIQLHLSPATVIPNVLPHRLPHPPPFISGLLSIPSHPCLGFLYAPPSLLSTPPILHCYPFLTKFKITSPLTPPHIQLFLLPLHFFNR